MQKSGAGPVAVIVIVVVCVVVVVLVKIDDGIDIDDPLFAIPVISAVFVRVQVKVVPGMLLMLLKLIAVNAVSLQRAGWVAGDTVILGDGFTSTCAVVVLLQPFTRAVTVKVTNWSTAVVFISVPEIVDPVPLGIPVTGPMLLRVQLNTVPATLFGLASTILVIGNSPQTVCEAGRAVTVGFGLTVIVKVEEVTPGQLAVEENTVIVVVCGILVVLVNEPERKDAAPLPLAGTLINSVSLSLVQVKVPPAILELKLTVAKGLSEQTP